jgi:hypothetical protein
MDPAFNILKVGRWANNSEPYKSNVQKPKEIYRTDQCTVILREAKAKVKGL